MRTWCFNQDAKTLDFVWAGRLHPGAASDYNAMYIEPMRKSASPISTWGEQVPRSDSATVKLKLSAGRGP
jgi:hypothetical protein